MVHLLFPPSLHSKFCITIICNFFWDMKMSQEKSKTMPTPNFLGGKRGVLYDLCKQRISNTLQYSRKREILIIVAKAINGPPTEYLRNLFCILDNVNNLRGMNAVTLGYAIA